MCFYHLWQYLHESFYGKSLLVPNWTIFSSIPGDLDNRPLPMVVSLYEKMKFSNKDFFRKCYQIRGKLRIWTHLLKKSLMENFIFCAVSVFDSVTVIVAWFPFVWLFFSYPESRTLILKKLEKPKRHVMRNHSSPRSELYLRNRLIKLVLFQLLLFYIFACNIQ